MPPVLRSRKPAPLAVKPAAKKQNTKLKRKVKQLPVSSRPKQKVEKREAESPEESPEKPIAHGQGALPPPSTLTQPLHVTLLQKAQERESGSSVTPKEGPPFIFQYNGFTLAGGTFEQRASVIAALLDSQDSSGVQSEPVILEDLPNYDGESISEHMNVVEDEGV